MSQKPPEKFEVGDQVQLDSQPFVWTVVETEVNGHPTAIKIKRKCVGELTDTLARTVDVYRLRVVE